MSSQTPGLASPHHRSDVQLFLYSRCSVKYRGVENVWKCGLYWQETGQWWGIKDMQLCGTEQMCVCTCQVPDEGTWKGHGDRQLDRRRLAFRVCVWADADVVSQQQEPQWAVQTPRLLQSYQRWVIRGERERERASSLSAPLPAVGLGTVALSGRDFGGLQGGKKAAHRYYRSTFHSIHCLSVQNSWFDYIYIYIDNWVIM